jgi:hypothetical protein
MLSQANILPTTPVGANLIGGATFRAWAPRATAVYVNGTFGGTPMTGQTNALLMAKDTRRTPMDIGRASSPTRARATSTIFGSSGRRP